MYCTIINYSVITLFTLIDNRVLQHALFVMRILKIKGLCVIPMCYITCDLSILEEKDIQCMVMQCPKYTQIYEVELRYVNIQNHTYSYPYVVSGMCPIRVN